MIKASTQIYEKYSSPVNRSDKFYRTVILDLEKRTQRPLRKKHRTASDTFKYADRFNAVLARLVNQHNSAMMGQFLKAYETSRYPWWVRLYTFLAKMFTKTTKSIIVPQGAEELSDVSFYQRSMNWAKYATKARSVILRLGQNIWIDTELEYNYSEARKYGLLLGGYWFYDDRISPSRQAAVLKEAVKGKTFELPIFVDWENSYGGGYGGVGNVVAFMQLLESFNIPCEAIGMYTGYYFFLEHTKDISPAQLAYLKSHLLWLAWYAAASIIKIPRPWTEWFLWQYGTPVIDMGQPTAEIDMNKANMTQAEFAVRYGLTVNNDEYQTYRRFNSDVYAVRIQPATAKVTNTNGTLQTVSSVARDWRVGVNGDAWDIHSPAPYYPLQLSVSMGEVVVPLKSSQPYLNITRDGRAVIRHGLSTDWFNVVSGVRYLVVDGVKKAYLNGIETEYVERHPRTGFGIRGDGTLVILVVEGRSESDSGITLSELADLFVAEKCVIAIDGDGGGSSALWYNGQIRNKPSDGQERPVVSHLLVGEILNMAKNKVTVTWPDGCTERPIPSTNSTPIYIDTSTGKVKSILPFGFSYDVDANIIDDQDYPTDPNKKWIKSPLGFIAVRYPASSGLVERATVEPIVVTPPPSAQDSISIFVERDGQVIKTFKISGTLEES